MKRLWLIQAIGNALLFWCFFTWLGIRDAKTWQLLETAVVGILILLPWLWLQNGTLNYCGDPSQGLWPAFRRALKTLALFTMIFAAFVLISWALGKLDEPMSKAGQRTASWLTFHLRRPVKPATWSRAYLAILWGVRWILLPAALLPIAAGVARMGTQGLSRRGSKVFWLEYLLALLAGYYLPGLLMTWVPKLSGTGAQVASFLLRFGFAYALMITAWLAVSFFSARDREVNAPVGF